MLYVLIVECKNVDTPFTFRICEELENGKVEVVRIENIVGSVPFRHGGECMASLAISEGGEERSPTNDAVYARM